MRECTKCHQWKDESEFYTHMCRGVESVRHVCKECSKAQRKQNYNPVEHVAQTLTQDVVAQFLDACDYKESLIDQIPEEKFHSKYHVSDTSLSYDEIKTLARQRLEELGYNNPPSVTFHQDGTYVIIGDTFGKHTPTRRFEMLQNVVHKLKAKAVISIGHHTDDYNDVSNAFKLFSCPVYMLPIHNELVDVHQFCSANNMTTVLDRITVGDVLIKNQEHITPYSATMLDTLKAREYPGKCIVNCTRHEYYTRNHAYEQSVICSPGAMAEPHVIRTVYKMILQSGKPLNLAPVNKESFLKYRKNEVDKQLWECGFIVLTVQGKNTSIQMVRVDPTNTACVVNDTYITSTGCSDVTPTWAVLADIHSPVIDDDVWQWLIQDLNKSRPSQILINGDLLDSRAFNPHNEREARQSDLLSDVAMTESLVKELSHIANVTLLMGNHEDFMRRFFDKHPQLESLIYKYIEDSLSKHCDMPNAFTDKDVIYPITKDTTVLHGSSRLYGAKGGYMDQLASSVDKNVIIGHFHSPAIHQGVYTSGCLCNLAQGYNNPNINNWAQGYIKVYSINGFTFIKQEIY